jgi:hypothetical protein
MNSLDKLKGREQQKKESQQVKKAPHTIAKACLTRQIAEPNRQGKRSGEHIKTGVLSQEEYRNHKNIHKQIHCVYIIG